MQVCKGDGNITGPDVVSSIRNDHGGNTELPIPTSDTLQHNPSTSIDERASIECTPTNACSMITMVGVIDVLVSEEATQKTSLRDLNHEQARIFETRRLRKENSSIQPEHGLQERSRYSIITSLLNKTVRQSVRKSTGSVPFVAELGQRLSLASVVDPALLGPNQCSAIVVNYISAGYILLPFGKSTE